MVTHTRAAVACGCAEAGGEWRRQQRGLAFRNLRPQVGGCSLRHVKALLLISGLLAFSATAFADAPKNAPTPSKLGRDERVYVMDKDAPSLEKTVPLVRPRIVFKNK
jgi:hypothetical protein